MSGQPLISTDNGFIFRRNGPNDYSLVFHGSGLPSTDHDAVGEIIGFGPNAPMFNDPAKITCWPASEDLRHSLYSSDSGATWTVGTVTLPSPSSPANPPKDGSYNTLMDEDGHVYLSVSITGHQWLVKSTDYTASTFAALIDATALGLPSYTFRFATYVADGWIWWMLGGSGVGGSTLHRWATDGTAHASWTVSGQPVGLNLGSYGLSGWPRTKRLVCWAWAGDSPILSIDVTDPTNPAFTWSIDRPFGARGPNFESNIEWDIVPLTNQILIGNAVHTDSASPGHNTDPNFDLHGTIWRSADGGATWSNVVSDTTNLGVAATYAGDGYDNEMSAVAPDPTDNNHIWAAMCPPYVYHSADQGATWDFETVDLSVCDPFGGVRPQEWCGISVTGTASPPSTGSAFVFGIIIG